MQVRFYVGSYSTGRYQFAEGGLRGSVVVIGRFGYRRDNRAYAASTGTGRTWTNVKLYFSDCDINNLSITWTKNSLTVAKKLFDSKYSWPSFTTAPKNKPAAFDPQLSFPLTSTYTYLGKKAAMGGEMPGSAINPEVLPRWRGAQV